MRIATWNLERPRRREGGRERVLRGQLDSVGADIWVLTETSDAIGLSPGHRIEAAPTVDPRHRPGESWVAVGSRWPMRRLPTCEPAIALCVEIESPAGLLLVYGTCLPYHGEGTGPGGLPAWRAHEAAIEVQGADWVALRRAHPRHRFCLAGDFNQSRDGRRWAGGREWYGTRRVRERLGAWLEAAGLVCVTAGDLVAAGVLAGRSTIDHICLDPEWAVGVEAVGAWEAGEARGRPVSDHNGTWVDVGSPSGPRQ